MKQYFYIDSNNQQIGPIRENALIGLMKCGAISRQMLIWTEGLEGWVPFGEVFPEDGEETSILPQGAESSTAATEAPVVSLPQEQPKLWSKHFIIGGSVALIAALSFSAYFASGDSDSPTNVTTTAKTKKTKRSRISKEKAVEELRKLEIISSNADITGVVGSLALADACKGRNIKVAELLIIAGADTKIVNEDCVLSDVIGDNQQELVKLLLAAPGIDVNIAKKKGHTPLSLAASMGMADIVKLLLAAPGIDVNKQERTDNRTPLAIAAEKGYTEIVKLLLAAPEIDVNNSHAPFLAPLTGAAEEGHTEIVKLLLAAPGIDVNEGGALVKAVKADQKEVVKILLAAPGIDVNKNSPLVTAAGKGLKDEVRLLLAAPGIDVNKKGDCNNSSFETTPLYAAVYTNHTDVVRILLSDTRIKANAGHVITAILTRNVDMAKLFLNVPGIDFNNVGSDGTTILGTAAFIGSSELVELLLNKPGIDVNKPNEGEGRTPLVTAAQAGHEHIVKLLLSSRGVDVNKSDVNGNTPLHFAVGNSHRAIVELLLASPNIEVNKPNKEGITPLRAAYIVGHKLIYELLMNAGGKLLAN